MDRTRLATGLLFGVIALGLAGLVVAFASPDLVTGIGTTVDLAQKVLGFFGVTIGLGTIGAKALRSGAEGLTWDNAAWPGILTVTGALMLATAG
jgi:hypothetical protein